jgi:hypothetical protein
VIWLRNLFRAPVPALRAGGHSDFGGRPGPRGGFFFTHALMARRLQNRTPAIVLGFGKSGRRAYRAAVAEETPRASARSRKRSSSGDTHLQRNRRIRRHSHGRK